MKYKKNESLLYNYESIDKRNRKATFVIFASSENYSTAILEKKAEEGNLTIFLEKKLLPEIKEKFINEEQGFLNILKMILDLHKQGKSIRLNDEFFLIPRLKITIKGSEEQ